MGLLDRLKSRTSQHAASTVKRGANARVQVLDGDDDLEVVGESHYQPALWALCGGRTAQRVRHPIVAVLVPQPHNPHDSNAVAVFVEGSVVGYLTRETAALAVRNLNDLMTLHQAHIGLRGVVVGGGYYDGEPGLLGVWLEHDPNDFGLKRSSSAPPGRPAAGTGTMRTGFSEAWLTDAEDDSYDLSWFNELPEADRPAIAKLRHLLARDPDPIDRHFQFAELESRLYRCRDLYDSALDEFDDACRLHDAEMETICQAFMVKWSKVPLLETYRQMAIRQQKKKDWNECLKWAQRGLDLYGGVAAREDAVEDLIKRRNRARQKLDAASTVRAKPPVVPTAAAASAPSPRVSPQVPVDAEVLTCGRCGTSFERLRVRGRKPSLCPPCRTMSV